VAESITPLEYLNKTELLQILSNAGHGNLRLSARVPQERLITLIRTGNPPRPDELAGTTETRKKLQVWVAGNWGSIGSQLPCSGTNKGRCTVYPCSEGRHLECYLSAKEHLL